MSECMTVSEKLLSSQQEHRQEAKEALIDEIEFESNVPGELLLVFQKFKAGRYPEEELLSVAAMVAQHDHSLIPDSFVREVGEVVRTHADKGCECQVLQSCMHILAEVSRNGPGKIGNTIRYVANYIYCDDEVIRNYAQKTFLNWGYNRKDIL